MTFFVKTLSVLHWHCGNTQNRDTDEEILTYGCQRVHLVIYRGVSEKLMFQQMTQNSTDHKSREYCSIKSILVHHWG